MNRNWMTAIVVVVVVAVGGYYFLSGDAEVRTDTGEEVAKEETKKLTLKDLFFMGEDFQCQFSQDNETSRSSGVMYLAESGERIRVDFSVESEVGGPIEGSIIRKDNFSYLWSSAMEEGIKVAITEENKQELFTGEGAGMVDENTEFDCVAWVENTRMFELPEGVEFMDMSSMLPS